MFRDCSCFCLACRDGRDRECTTPGCGRLRRFCLKGGCVDDSGSEAASLSSLDPDDIDWGYDLDDTPTLTLRDTPKSEKLLRDCETEAERKQVKERNELRKSLTEVKKMVKDRKKT
eukprot:TRINITY_DN1594_c0_g1_i14.p1 TRINITY_DN1594_c0_g1~~TRINITY_DN1594_c0_g1_i14.p1  ORF type:complete len:116 (+),score=4.87 TRINITY_DN1594_c0_g1_i14:294-641(+)